MPPKIVPIALVSRGIMMIRIAGTLSFVMCSLFVLIADGRTLSGAPACVNAGGWNTLNA